MDIDQIDNSHRAKLSSTVKVNKEHGFKKILDQKVAEIDPPTLQAPIDNKAEVLERSDKIINLLDDYARGLTDPTKTLRDIEPLIESIRKEVSLIEAQASDEAYDDELGSFIKDLAVTANVTVYKFYRGDYIKS